MYRNSDGNRWRYGWTTTQGFDHRGSKHHFRSPPSLGMLKYSSYIWTNTIYHFLSQHSCHKKTSNPFSCKPTMLFGNHISQKGHLCHLPSPLFQVSIPCLCRWLWSAAAAARSTCCCCPPRGCSSRRAAGHSWASGSDSRAPALWPGCQWSPSGRCVFLFKEVNVGGKQLWNNQKNTGRSYSWIICLWQNSDCLCHQGWYWSCMMFPHLLWKLSNFVYLDSSVFWTFSSWSSASTW